MQISFVDHLFAYGQLQSWLTHLCGQDRNSNRLSQQIYTEWVNHFTAMAAVGRIHPSLYVLFYHHLCQITHPQSLCLVFIMRRTSHRWDGTPVSIHHYKSMPNTITPSTSSWTDQIGKVSDSTNITMTICCRRIIPSLKYFYSTRRIGSMERRREPPAVPFLIPA